MTFKRILVAGFGTHFKDRYFEVLKPMFLNKSAEIAAIIDLECKKNEINDFISKNYTLPKPTMIFLPEEMRNNLTTVDIDKEVGYITHVLVCTEPKVHKPFLIWAIDNNIPVFVDKPITAFSRFEDINQLLDDYLEIEQKAIKNKVLCTVSCERRMHPGYMFIINNTKNFIRRYGVPLTFVDINFAGGQCILLDEFLKENHPYKYGYGSILHSGYHYVDLLSQFLKLNDHLLEDKETEMRINLIYNNLRDLIHIKEMVFPKYFGYKENNFSLYSDSYSSIRHFGEIDFLMNGQLYNNQNLLSSFSLKLIQNSVSIRRNGYKHPNPHKQEGRLRQESINLHLSNFRSINIRSFPYSKLDNSRFKSEDFNIDIMTNPVLVNEKSLEIYENSYFVPNNAPATYKHNIYSRQKQLSEFLDGRDGNSSISSHKKTVEIISKIYSIIKEESVNEKL